MHTDSFLSEYIPPAGRRPPPELVRELREIVPEADLIYLGRGIWGLGTVRPNRLLHRAACRTIEKIDQIRGDATKGDFFISAEHQKELTVRLYTMHLHRQGWRAINNYYIQGPPDRRIVEDLREREWRYQTQLETCIRRSEEAMRTDHDLEARQEKVREYFRLEHKSIHRRAFRHARSFVSAGIRKAKQVTQATTQATQLVRKAS